MPPPSSPRSSSHAATLRTRHPWPIHKPRQRVARRPIRQFHVPSAEAVEAMPGIYVASVFQRPKPGIQIETMQEIFFIETVYDARGREAATSVPSSRWSLLSQESRITLGGMRSGDRRRIWRCAEGSKNPCRVEDVQVFDGAEARARPNSPLQPTATAPPSS